MRDILKVWVPDLMHCVMLCAEYNFGLDTTSGFCRGVSMVEKPGEFCYLKSATGVNDTSTSGNGPYVSAELL